MFSADDYREPVSIVTSETRWYAAQHTVGNHNRGAVEMFKMDHHLGELDLPPSCDHPSKLAIMQP